MTESRKQKGKTSNIAVLLAVSLTLILIFGGAFALCFWKGRAINESDIRSAEKIMGLTFTRKERRMLLDNTRRNLRSYTALRDVDIPNSIPPAFQFNPVVDPEKHPIRETSFSFVPDPAVILPENREKIAFYSINRLASLIQTQQITSMELTELYLGRLHCFPGHTECGQRASPHVRQGQPTRRHGPQLEHGQNRAHVPQRGRLRTCF